MGLLLLLLGCQLLPSAAPHTPTPCPRAIRHSSLLRWGAREAAAASSRGGLAPVAHRESFSLPHAKLRAEHDAQDCPGLFHQDTSAGPRGGASDGCNSGLVPQPPRGAQRQVAGEVEHVQPEELSTPPEELSTPPTANAVAAKLRDGPSVGSGQLRPSTVSTGSPGGRGLRVEPQWRPCSAPTVRAVSWPLRSRHRSASPRTFRAVDGSSSGAAVTFGSRSHAMLDPDWM